MQFSSSLQVITLTLSALVSAAAVKCPSGTTLNTSFKCPSSDISRTSCLGPKDCLYPNPAACNSFIQCIVNTDGVAGTACTRPCPVGLLWDNNHKTCSVPEDSTCPKKTSSFHCPTEEMVASGCVDSKCLYANPENRNSFIRCGVKLTGLASWEAEPVVVTCPDKLQWNDGEKICAEPGEGDEVEVGNAKLQVQIRGRRFHVL